MTDEQVTPYAEAYAYARAFESEAWGRASQSSWARLESIASEYQRGEYGWDRARALLDETVKEVRDSDVPPA